MRHRIEQRTRARARGQGPFGGGGQAGVARIFPISVPALFGRGGKGQRHFAAGRGTIGLGHQLDADMRAGTRRLRGGRRGEQEEQHCNETETKPSHAASLPRKSVWTIAVLRLLTNGSWP